MAHFHTEDFRPSFNSKTSKTILIQNDYIIGDEGYKDVHFVRDTK